MIRGVVIGTIVSRSQGIRVRERVSHVPESRGRVLAETRTYMYMYIYIYIYIPGLASARKDVTYDIELVYKTTLAYTTRLPYDLKLCPMLQN